MREPLFGPSVPFRPRRRSRNGIQRLVRGWPLWTGGDHRNPSLEALARAQPGLLFSVTEKLALLSSNPRMISGTVWPEQQRNHLLRRKALGKKQHAYAACLPQTSGSQGQRGIHMSQPTPELSVDNVFVYHKSAAIKAAIGIGLFTAIGRDSHTIGTISQQNWLSELSSATKASGSSSRSSSQCRGRSRRQSRCSTEEVSGSGSAI
jgi:hypothetical protein